jgi:hypothetical protein
MKIRMRQPNRVSRREDGINRCAGNYILSGSRKWLAFAARLAYRYRVRPAWETSDKLVFATPWGGVHTRLERWLAPLRAISIRLAIFRGQTLIHLVGGNYPEPASKDSSTRPLLAIALVPVERRLERMMQSRQRIDFERTAWSEHTYVERILHPSYEKNLAGLQPVSIVYGPVALPAVRQVPADQKKYSEVNAEAGRLPMQASQGFERKFPAEPAINVNLLADEVLRTLDRRLIAYQERLGRE